MQRYNLNKYLYYFCIMIFVTGFGQICNNILQFGHLYAWGKERDLSVIAMRFCYKYPFFKISKIKYYNWFTYLFAKYGSKMGCIPKVSFRKEEDVNSKNLQMLETGKFVLVEGWQLRDYDAFLRHRDEIKDLFSLNEKIKKAVHIHLPVKSENKIRLGVHIRRGDYKTWMNGNYFYSDADFIQIIQSFANLFPKKEIEIIIVSNDKAIPKELYYSSLKKSACFLSGNPGEDLYALSTCDYLIGPPSTFSLMASFYNDANLYWIFDKKASLTKDSFKKFDYLFRHIL